MDRDFKLATELTEDDVGGDWLVARSATGATRATGAGTGLNPQAKPNGVSGLLYACLAIGVVWVMFPGNQRNSTPDITQASPPPAWSAAPAPQTSAASVPASGVGKATRKAAQPATHAGHDGAEPVSAPRPTP